ncbi:MAG: C40 family peptidase [Actinomycetota bacterium]|nr:C40 family peptidase [Actinomycetota bacterium]
MIDAIATTALLTLVNQVSGTPYRTGGDSPSGTDCSGLVSWVANAATGRPVYGDRFHTGNEEQALLARGFKYGTQSGALNVGWNSGHTAVTLPDGTPVSSGESGGGVRVGGGGAFQPQFTRHMYLPLAQADEQQDPAAPPPPFDPFAPPPPPADPFAAAAGPGPADIPALDGVSNELPPPPPGPELPPAPELAPTAI